GPATQGGGGAVGAPRLPEGAVAYIEGDAVDVSRGPAGGDTRRPGPGVTDRGPRSPVRSV
ncbi:MAG: hypothetical protein AVDCRST_MAG05-434, partial [uncultured Rubrobacteraceae bacterium]